MANNDGHEDEIEYADIGVEPATDAVRSLPLALLESVVGTNGIREISDRKGYCLVLQAPGPDWVVPLYKVVKRLGDWDYFIQRNAAKRSRQEDDTSEKVVEALAAGGRVFGIPADGPVVFAFPLESLASFIANTDVFLHHDDLLCLGFIMRVGDESHQNRKNQEVAPDTISNVDGSSVAAAFLISTARGKGAILRSSRSRSIGKTDRFTMDNYHYISICYLKFSACNRHPMCLGRQHWRTPRPALRLQQPKGSRHVCRSYRPLPYLHPGIRPQPDLIAQGGGVRRSRSCPSRSSLRMILMPGR